METDRARFDWIAWLFWGGCIAFICIGLARLPSIMEESEAQLLDKQTEAMRTEGDHRIDQFWREHRSGRPHDEYRGPVAKPYGSD